jgi:hypothetical protein
MLNTGRWIKDDAQKTWRKRRANVQAIGTVGRKQGVLSVEGKKDGQENGGLQYLSLLHIQLAKPDMRISPHKNACHPNTDKNVVVMVVIAGSGDGENWQWRGA